MKTITKYTFFDYNGKITHHINNKNIIYFNLYRSNDSYSSILGELNKKNNLNWGNKFYSFRWQTIASNNTFGTLDIYQTSFSNFLNKHSYDLRNNFYGNKLDLIERSAKISLETIFLFHKLKYGTMFSWYQISPEIFYVDSIGYMNQTYYNSYSKKYSVQQQNLFLEDYINVTSRLSISAGINLIRYIAENQKSIKLHPRVAIGYEISSKITLKGSYNSLQQSLQVLQSTILGSPFDLWVPSISSIQPAKAHTYVIGCNYHLHTNWELSVEAYYKKMKKIIRYKEGYNMFSDLTDWSSLITVGEGDSKGIEFSLSKRKGYITGWCSYTLSKSNRKYDQINFGQTFPFDFDRRHMINLVLIGQVSKKINIGTTCTYLSGNPVTLSNSNVLYDVDGEYDFMYVSGINNVRLPSYQRIDVNFNYKTALKQTLLEVNFGAYNILNRRNPNYAYRNTEGIVIQYLFPILPYFNITLKY